ncbi:MAG: acetyl-CoA C-acetyltransferase [Erysipelotrichaceae bacterium]
MNKVYIVAAKRTALGSHLGSLKGTSASDMGSAVIKALLDQTKIDPACIDEVMMGNILPAGQGQGIARQCSIKAGIPVSVPAYGVNMVCGSGMKSVMNAYMEIKAGVSDVVIAGGTENMSAAPYLMPKEVRTGIKMGDITMKDHMLTDALWDAFDGLHMGVTAENIASKYSITREEQDAFAYESQKKAIKAVDAGVFADEIVPIEVKIGRDTVMFATDEYPNRKTDLEKLGTLRPAFKKDGTVTAGTSSGINDGASAVMVVSEEALLKYNLKPMVEIIGIGQGGVEPSLMGLGPTPAIRNALKMAKIKLQEIDVLELNEAFAAQSLGVMHELIEEHGITKEELLAKTNPNGGAIALGHPVGASGNRILVTLVNEMLKMDVTYGLASLCIGGGMGTAVVVKKV